MLFRSPFQAFAAIQVNTAEDTNEVALAADLPEAIVPMSDVVPWPGRTLGKVTCVQGDPSDEFRREQARTDRVAVIRAMDTSGTPVDGRHRKLTNVPQSERIANVGDLLDKPSVSDGRKLVVILGIVVVERYTQESEPAAVRMALTSAFEWARLNGATLVVPLAERGWSHLSATKL